MLRFFLLCVQEETSLDSTFGVEFDSDFLTAISSIEKNHWREQQLKENLNNFASPLSSAKTKSVIVESDALKESLEASSGTKNLPKGRLSTHCNQNPGFSACTGKRVLSKLRSYGLMSSPNSDVSLPLCSPLHISTPTNAYRKNRHKRRTRTTLNSTNLCCSNPKTNKAKLFGNIHTSADSVSIAATERNKPMVAADSQEETTGRTVESSHRFCGCDVSVCSLEHFFFTFFVFV